MIQKKLLLILLSLTTSIILLELIFGLINFSKKGVSVKYSQSFFQLDKDLGYKLEENSVVSAQAFKSKKKILYDVKYSIDSYGKRITPLPTTGDYSILFFGCSVTFGEGVHDNETLPFFVGKYAKSANVFNFGVSGYGPQQMLVRLENQITSEEISKSNHKIAIYTFINAHIPRAIGSLKIYNSWGRDTPYFDFDENNLFRRFGSFQSGRPLQSQIYHSLRFSQILKYFDYPFYFTKEHLSITHEIIKKSYLSFKSQFKSDDFYVLLYPDTKTRTVNFLKKLFDKEGIKYLDYSSMRFRSDAYQIKEEGHPNPNAYNFLAKQIVRDISVLSPKNLNN